MIEDKIFSSAKEFSAWTDELVMQGATINEQYDGEGTITVDIEGSHIVYNIIIKENS